MINLNITSTLILPVVVGLLAFSYASVIPQSINPADISVQPVNPIPDDKPVPAYDQFFKNLTEEEQVGLMSLAVYYYDSDIGLNPTKPFPTKSGIHEGHITPITDLEIPKTVYAHLLNGNIPSEWQRAFTKWLKKEYKLHVKHFEQFKMTQSFCLPGEMDCPELKNIGGTCCPFG